MRKPFVVCCVCIMLLFSACTSTIIPNPTPTTPPTRVLSFITPSATNSPTATASPSPTATATPSPTPYRFQLPIFFSYLFNPPQPMQVNGLAYEEFVIMPPEAMRHIRRIYFRGQRLGRNPQAFSRTGDSTIERPNFFYRFDEGDYHLGVYRGLQATIDYYAGSFGHDSVAVRRGLHSWSVLDPMWADAPCEAGEHMLQCEIRLQNPSIFIIRLGSNDQGAKDLLEESFRAIVEFCLEEGVIPVLATKADRFEGSNETNEFIRALAEEYELPLWDFDIVAGSLENRGLGNDGVHLTTFPQHDWRLPEAYTTGHGLHNLTGLIMLDAIWQVLHEP